MKNRKFDRKREDIAFALAMGWEYARHTGSGHLQFVHPSVTFKLTIACSPSEFRSTRNTIAWIRRHTPTPEVQ